MLQIVDHRGNVVVVDGSGARLVGSLKQIPVAFIDGVNVEVTLIVGTEPVQLRLAVVEGCECRPGAIAIVSLVAWLVGGRHFLPDDGRAPVRGESRDSVTVPSGEATSLPHPAAPPRAPAGLSGRLEQMSLIDTVQMLCTSQRSGVVDIEGVDHHGAPLRGTLALRRGQVCFAEFAGDRGEEAFFALVAVSRGAFAVDFNALLPTANIERETTFLLLDHLRRLDESTRLPAHRGHVQAIHPVDAFDDSVVVRPAMAVSPVTAVVVETKPTATPAPLENTAKKRAPKKPPPLPERAEPTEARTGRFSRFFDEFQPSPQRTAPPPSVDDVELPATDAAGFASLAFTLSNTHSPFDRDTDIIDRALISH